MTPADAHFNQDSGYELPDCCIAVYNKLRGRASFSSARQQMRGVHKHVLVS